MDARNNPYIPLSSDNAALVLVDHQLGLLTGVRDIPVAELKNNVVSLAKAMQILKHHGIIADKYVLSPHSVNLFVPVENREAAVRALHALI